MFNQSLVSAEKITDRFVRVSRYAHLARQWRVIDPEKGKELLLRAEAEARGTGMGDSALFDILRTRIAWEPEKCLAVLRDTDSPGLRASVLLEGARILRQKTVEQDLKILERARKSAEGEKNFALMARIASTWYEFDAQKGLEILAQIDDRELRVKALREIAREGAPGSRLDLLGLAEQDALAADELGRKLELLKGVGRDWSGIDPVRAAAVWDRAYRVAEREYLSSPAIP